MTFEIPDLTSLPLTTIVAMALVIAAVDVLASIAVALVRGTFAPARILDYLRSHVLMRVFPILALAVVGHGIEAFSVPAIPAASIAASASLAFYVVETLGSLRDSFSPTAAPPVEG